jgi:hypothetical protein
LIKCLATKNSLGFSRISESLTVEKAYQGTKINRLANVIGDQNLIKIVIVLIDNVVNSFNLKNNMNEDQVISSAIGMIASSPDWSIEDFSICLRKGKEGKYGKNYASFDGQTINIWMEAYDKERSKAIDASNKRDEPNEPIALRTDIYEKLIQEKVLPDKKDDEEYESYRREYLKNKILKEGK